MILFHIRRENFTLNPCSCQTEFRPFSWELYDSLAILLLMEAYSFSFARAEGPLPYTASLPPWTSLLSNHTFYFINSELIHMHHYWDSFIRWFWGHSLEGPLPDSTLLIINQNLKDLFYKTSSLQVTTDTSAATVARYCERSGTMKNYALVRTFRTDFSRPDIISNTALHGLLMRERFDKKERPRKKWDDNDYLRKHRLLLNKVMRSTTDSSE